MFRRLRGLGNGQTDKQYFYTLCVFFLIHNPLMLKNHPPVLPWKAFPHALSPTSKAWHFLKSSFIWSLWSIYGRNWRIWDKQCLSVIWVPSLHHHLLRLKAIFKAQRFAPFCERIATMNYGCYKGRDPVGQKNYRPWFVSMWNSHRFKKFCQIISQ